MKHCPKCTTLAAVGLALLGALALGGVWPSIAAEPTVGSRWIGISSSNTRSSMPVAAEPTVGSRWIQVCNVDGLLYALGRGGALLRSDTEYPADLQVIGARWDGDQDVGARACVSYLVVSAAYADDATATTDRADVAFLTAGQPMWENAVEAARREAGMVPTLTGEFALGALRAAYPKRYEAWKCANGRDEQFWLYLVAVGTWDLAAEPEGTVRIFQGQGDAFWAERETAERYFYNGCPS